MGWANGGGSENVIAGQVRATNRRAIDGVVNAWIFELRAQDLMLNVVQTDIDAAHLQHFRFPWPTGDSRK